MHSNFKSFSKLNGSELAKNIYATSQLVITRSNEREFPMYSNKTNEFRYKKLYKILGRYSSIKRIR